LRRAPIIPCLISMLDWWDGQCLAVPEGGVGGSTSWRLGMLHPIWGRPSRPFQAQTRPDAPIDPGGIEDEAKAHW